MHLICHPKFCITLVFLFLLCITAIPREIENNSYAIFSFFGGGGGGCILGKWRVRISWLLLTEDSYLILHMMKDVVT